MKRDASGRFIRSWKSETKQRVSITLTNTAWRSLDSEASNRGISRSEVIERFARNLSSQPILEPQDVEVDAQVASLQKQVLEQQQTIANLQQENQALKTQLEASSAAIVTHETAHKLTQLETEPT